MKVGVSLGGARHLLGSLSDRDCFFALHDKFKREFLDEHGVKGDEGNEGEPAKKKQSAKRQRERHKNCSFPAKICWKRDELE